MAGRFAAVTCPASATVLVAFERAYAGAVLIGSLWNAFSPPPLQSPMADIRAIRTLVGNQIVITEKPPSITLQTAPTPSSALPAPPSPTGPHQTLMMSSAGVRIMTPTMVQISVGTTIVTVSPETVSVVVGGTTLTLSKSVCSIHAPAISIVADGTVDIKGATIRLNS
jgi:hypothetical protein